MSPIWFRWESSCIEWKLIEKSKTKAVCFLKKKLFKEMDLVLSAI